jgi:uncharacterized protein YbcV (DUF1398 family)
MFTIEHIHQAYSKVKSGADFPQLVQDLKSLGIVRYDNVVADGTTKYYGADNKMVQGDAKYPVLQVSNTGSVDKLKHALSIHQQGQTDYPTFCRHAADAGVEKWTTHMVDMTVTYFDKHGNALIVESIPQP